MMRANRWGVWMFTHFGHQNDVSCGCLVVDFYGFDPMAKKTTLSKPQEVGHFKVPLTVTLHGTSPVNVLLA